MRTLIAHHLEPMWESGYQKAAGLTTDELCRMVGEHCKNIGYNKIIITRMEEFCLEDCHYDNGLGQAEVRTYGYGWVEQHVKAWIDCGNDASDWVEGGAHSNFVFIAPWMRQLTGEVHICGAFDFECIEDLEIALRHLDIDYKRIEDLII